MRWYAPRLLFVLVESNEHLDDNLQVCESSSQDVPAPGDAGGVWYCGGGSASPIQSCNDARQAGKTFGIPQGQFADFRNFSSSSSAAATPSKSISAVIITTNAGGQTSTVTVPANTLGPSCPAHTGGENTLSDGKIAGIVIGSVSAILIAVAIGILSERRRARRAGTVQTAEGNNDGQRYWKMGTETVGRQSMENTIRELPASERRVPELGTSDSRGAGYGGYYS